MNQKKQSRGNRTLYKGDSFIVFYDRKDKYIKHIFDNVREILDFQHKEYTRKNVNAINVEIYLALRNKHHLTKFLDGEPLRLYIIKLDKGE